MISFRQYAQTLTQKIKEQLPHLLPADAHYLHRARWASLHVDTFSLDAEKLQTSLAGIIAETGNPRAAYLRARKECLQKNLITLEETSKGRLNKSIIRINAEIGRRSPIHLLLNMPTVHSYDKINLRNQTRNIVTQMQIIADDYQCLTEETIASSPVCCDNPRKSQTLRTQAAFLGREAKKVAKILENIDLGPKRFELTQ